MRINTTVLSILFAFLLVGCYDDAPVDYLYGADTESADVTITIDTTDPTPSPASPECLTDAHCQSGYYCDDGECVKCTSPEPDDLCDGVEIPDHQCRDYFCVNGEVKYNVVEGACDDGDDDTYDDYCLLGNCTGLPKQCEVDEQCVDSNPCTLDSCAHFVCEHEDLTAVPCDDGNSNTINDTCQDGVCVGIVVEPECKEDEDCLTGEVCQDGVCVPDEQPECKYNSDCEDGEICEDGECVSAPPECVENIDCPTGEVCQDGECVPDEQPECKYNSDCEDGEICDDGECVSAPPECVFNSDCGPHELCVAGECVPECKEDVDCDDGEQCVNGACVFTGECSDDSDCDDQDPYTKDLCEDNWCIHEDLECIADSDCADEPDDKCVSGDLWVYNTQGQCLNDECYYGHQVVDCDYGCSDGECLPQCYDDDDCGAGEVCDDGTCVFVGNCDDDSDCDDDDVCTNDYCNDGECVHTDKAGCCNYDTDCDSDEVCDDHVCVPDNVNGDWVTIGCCYDPSDLEGTVYKFGSFSWSTTSFGWGQCKSFSNKVDANGCVYCADPIDRNTVMGMFHVDLFDSSELHWAAFNDIQPETCYVEGLQASVFDYDGYGYPFETYP